MSRLEELKEKYAVQQGFDSWKELWFDTANFKHANERIDELVKMYAKECSQASLEKASEKTSIIENETSYVKQSEINIEENIVLL
ncbi:hypothetical protein AB670_00026 [Chryseobacterium sp. MOF25P]|uniref:hypothetical protein n=1 Tax=unclassified Chryseobacterium TaxID=2593645 RepID=UPI0008059C21|nr:MULTISPECIES: hypothetical protein [unclassified Chryseobacterium]OBW43497.1 hypothetical protein AB670_00026 [Chryseobacterium sp. MOF25P]OBW46729.1 hypothetical protein AB671_01225 [Chryseobacterium sp. BGARF1]